MDVEALSMKSPILVKLVRNLHLGRCAGAIGRVSDFQFTGRDAGSSPGCAPLRSRFGQAAYTCCTKQYN